MKGCNLNFDTINPLKAPTNPPMSMEMISATGISQSPNESPENILFAVPFACKREAQTQAQRPRHLPAERSVPVKTMMPATPSAIRRREADCIVILTIESNDKNL